MHLIFKKLISIIFSVFIIIFLPSCNISSREYKREMYALNTIINMTIYGENAETAENAVNAAVNEISRLEQLFSVTDAESDISKINASAGKYTEVSEETSELIKRAVDISAATGGSFDITVYPAVSLWGFTTGKYYVPTDLEIENICKYIDYKKISVKGNSVRIEKGMSLDLGGIAKGYISDKVAEILKKNGVKSATINLGGNVQTVGMHTDGSRWKIGIKDPQNNGNFAVLTCSETAVITSGAYQRNFVENGITYHHIIDPNTGSPAESEISSVTVISKDSTLCDALSTAFYVSGVQKSCEIAENLGVDYVILTSDNKIYVSDGVKSSINITGDFTLI